MFRIDDQGIMTLTRGDTARFEVEIMNDNEPYEIQSSDIIFFSVKKKAKPDEEYLVHKTFEGTGNIHLAPEDTQDIPGGKYTYDIQLNTAAGDKYTVVDTTSFIITEGVTDD